VVPGEVMVQPVTMPSAVVVPESVAAVHDVQAVVTVPAAVGVVQALTAVLVPAGAVVQRCPVVPLQAALTVQVVQDRVVVGPVVGVMRDRRQVQAAVLVRPRCARARPGELVRLRLAAVSEDVPVPVEPQRPVDRRRDLRTEVPVADGVEPHGGPPLHGGARTAPGPDPRSRPARGVRQ
jgi:hypothetical protein